MKLMALVLFFALPVQWQYDFATAQQQAKKEHKMILLTFSGSDWCAPCILTRREYLDSEVFLDMAKDNLILVNADFPRKKKNMPSAGQVKKNEALAEIYNKNGIFPLILLLNADGKVVRSWKGKPEVAVENFVQDIQQVCNGQK